MVVLQAREIERRLDDVVHQFGGLVREQTSNAK